MRYIIAVIALWVLLIVLYRPTFHFVDGRGYIFYDTKHKRKYIRVL